MPRFPVIRSLMTVSETTTATGWTSATFLTERRTLHPLEVTRQLGRWQNSAARRPRRTYLQYFVSPREGSWNSTLTCILSWWRWWGPYVRVILKHPRPLGPGSPPPLDHGSRENSSGPRLSYPPPRLSIWSRWRGQGSGVRALAHSGQREFILYNSYNGQRSVLYSL